MQVTTRPRFGRLGTGRDGTAGALFGALVGWAVGWLSVRHAAPFAMNNTNLDDRTIRPSQIAGDPGSRPPHSAPMSVGSTELIGSGGAGFAGVGAGFIGRPEVAL